uniref:Uncharacterized protein n=1 Tax=Alexandrium monilatum TaxID=311494 RepID=A0A7S4RY77_9DINO
MARTARRGPKGSWRPNLFVVLAALILVALLFSALVIFSVHGEELRHPNAAEHHLRERLRHLFARQSYMSGGGTVSAVEDGGAASAAQKADVAGPGGGGQESAGIQDPAEGTAAAAAAAVATATAASKGLRGGPAAAPPPAPAPASAGEGAQASGSSAVTWKKHTQQSCQGYADGDDVQRPLEESKAACRRNDACVGIECPHGATDGCTLRAVANLVPYALADCYELIEVSPDGKVLTARVHPAYNSLLREYPFQQVTTQSGNQVNIILVRSQVNAHQHRLYQKYKDAILFLGISSMNDYPLPQAGEEFDYLSMFPGFLHMMREPEKHFPPHVKTLLMSQSDFSLPIVPARDYSKPKKYDFTYSASDCDVASDGRGWCGWSKNWSFVKQALPVMCGEFKLTGVLVATKDKANRLAYSIPEVCKGRMIQTTYLARQSDYFNYLKQSRFAFLPQIHDASPRVSTQALAHDVPILMNYHILGGWKYVNNMTGEFFHDMSDFRQALQKLLKNSEIPHRYEPRRWVFENYGSDRSGERLLEFVKKHFSDRVKLPKGTKRLLI